MSKCPKKNNVPSENHSAIFKPVRSNVLYALLIHHSSVLLGVTYLPGSIHVSSATRVMHKTQVHPCVTDFIKYLRVEGNEICFNI